MIFDWGGLKGHRYFILKQTPDPLKYCNYSIPIPLGIGLPCMPCDLPNQYELISTDGEYSYEGDIYLKFQQQTTFLHRFLIPASHRPWHIIGKDYYHHTPYIGLRQINQCCTADRPCVEVQYQQKYIGRVVQKTICNFCCINRYFQVLDIYNQKQSLIFRIVSPNPQMGHCLIAPCCGFDRIVYNIHRIEEESEIDRNEYLLGEPVGQIVHLFNGLSQYTSKNDKYGLTLPQDCTQQQACLIVYSALLIDYLLFENF